MEYKVELSNIRNFPAWLGGKETLDNVIICGLENSLTVRFRHKLKSMIFFAMKETTFIIS